MLDLKPLKVEAIPAALDKAKHYRLLGEPDESESICLDILAADPNHQEALITLLLALTDKFASHGLEPCFEQARHIIERLDAKYCAAYFSGIIFERRAKFHLRKGGPGAGEAAYGWFMKALQAYQEAISSCDVEGHKAVLRWNSCARIINNNPDVIKDQPTEKEMLLDPYDTPH